MRRNVQVLSLLSFKIPLLLHFLICRDAKEIEMKKKNQNATIRICPGPKLSHISTYGRAGQARQDRAGQGNARQVKVW